ncbi:glycosyltransferase family A protein [Bacillus sp. 1P10SD]|uniref:glycosyltransferase family 2 protein n=1 Tax=Bacillus sp. 1P10SD TaxID=3132265 RepID=UPI0039A5374F
MKPTLTIFTPTYNRAYTLHLCYESLARQSCKDFEWLIVDDGSTDHTQDLVNNWVMEGKVRIQYAYQENQGMHEAHNKAYELINTELNVCIDSDDYMPDNAVEKILNFWKKHGSNEVAGIIGLDAKTNGEVLGTKLPEGIKTATLSGLHSKYKMKGDKKLVYRTELMKMIPAYPVFPGEKYCPLSFKYILVDQECPLLIMNEVLCYVEYLEDGSSMNIINQYKKNPKGFSFFRKTAMKYSPTLKSKFRESIHYVSSNFMVGNKKYLLDSPCKFVTLMATPFGALLYLYIKRTSRATVLKAN